MALTQIKKVLSSRSGESAIISSWWEMRTGRKTAREKVTVRRSGWWEHEGRRENEEREQRALCKSEGRRGGRDVEGRNRDLVVVRE